MAANMTRDQTLSIELEFGGGTELLTATKKTKMHSLKLPALVQPHELRASEASLAAAATKPAFDIGSVPGGPLEEAAANEVAGTLAQSRQPIKMRDLVEYVCRDIITERHAMLVEPDGSIRPGILVLINDADWELEGEMEYELQDGDHICMISTLHGG